MTDAEVYLDAASAMPLRPEARAAVMEALDAFGDPLTIHGPARAARAVIDDARVTVGRAIGAQADEVVFTSGGTESVALAIAGAARARREVGNRIVTSTVEHPSVGGIGTVLGSDGFEVVLVPADRTGRACNTRTRSSARCSRWPRQPGSRGKPGSSSTRTRARLWAACPWMWHPLV